MAENTENYIHDCLNLHFADIGGRTDTADRIPKILSAVFVYLFPAIFISKKSLLSHQAVISAFAEHCSASGLFFRPVWIFENQAWRIFGISVLRLV